MSTRECSIAAIAWLVVAYRRAHWILASTFLLLALALLGTALLRGSARTALLGAACLAWAVACADPRLLRSPREAPVRAAAATRVAFALAMVLGSVHALMALDAT